MGERQVEGKGNEGEGKVLVTTLHKARERDTADHSNKRHVP